MSIRSFFKPHNPLPKSEEEDERPLKKAKTSSDAPELANVTANPEEKPHPLSPGAAMANKETPKKGDMNATGAKEASMGLENATSASPDSNSTKKSELTAEQLARIQKNREIALARQHLVEKCKTEVVTIAETVEAMEPTWKDVLGGEFSKHYFRQLDEFVTSERKSSKPIFPPAHQTFSAFTHCPFDKVRVVIVGQDPYHGDRQAHGLCFSVQKGVQIPPSLLNMYKELQEDAAIDFRRPSHGCLTKWAEQGVLMLNACLSVRKGEANSHKGKGWETFTDAVIAAVNREKTGVVFLLWGRPAQEKCKAVDKKKHFVLTSVHPSPLSANRGAPSTSPVNASLVRWSAEDNLIDAVRTRTHETLRQRDLWQRRSGLGSRSTRRVRCGDVLTCRGCAGFFGCRHFSKCNELLESRGNKKIDWQL